MNNCSPKESVFDTHTHIIFPQKPQDRSQANMRKCAQPKRNNYNLLRILLSLLTLISCLFKSATCFSRDVIFSADRIFSTFKSFSSCWMKASWDRLPFGETCLCECCSSIVRGEDKFWATRSFITASANSLRATVSSDSSCLTRNSYCSYKIDRNNWIVNATYATGMLHCYFMCLNVDFKWNRNLFW